VIIANAKKGQVPFFYIKPPKEPIEGDVEWDDALYRLYGTEEIYYHVRPYRLRTLDDGEIETLAHILAENRFDSFELDGQRIDDRLRWKLRAVGFDGKTRIVYSHLLLPSLREVWIRAGCPSRSLSPDERWWWANEKTQIDDYIPLYD
jgi:hypothetical protein